ncbi:SH3 domain-containing protein [Aggregatilinea lenta]|uniref:SH3 domain-containing protein n=1 Tax=Aggregatilinea lenta TaxID=913108 RepID=UPI0013C36BFE|nr:SH3 domain-containing protein [Aggregatilinea lenta]
MYRKTLMLALAACLFGALPGLWAVRAQIENPAANLVLFVQGGNLWVWDVASGESQPITLNTHIEGVALSPAGGLVAMRDWSPISYDAWERSGGIGGGPLPSDIVVVNYVTLEPGMTIAAQPDDASFFVDGVPDSAILRSDPTWSPDGASVAWTELHYPSLSPESNRLVMYTFATGETRVVTTNLPDMMGVPQPLQVKWGEGGLALRVTLFDEASITYPEQILVYDTDGNLRAQTVVSEDEGALADYQWITWNDAPYVGIQFGDGHWELLDPATGNRQPAPAAPQLYGTVFPDDSLGLRVSRDAQSGSYWNSFTWTATTPDGQPGSSLPITSAPGSVALAADGQRIAYTNDHGGLSVWQNGQAIDMPGTLVVDAYAPVLWGPNGWRIAAAGNGDAPQDACATTLPPRLQPGVQAQVIPGTSANNLRADPGAGAASLGQIDPGAAFTVLDGPLCAGGMYWYQVDYNGTVGWTAEGDAAAYWIEPLPAS